MRVSAALIVREQFPFISLPRSLVDIVDEIVVVDTGSTDDTIDKACGFPIKLHRFRWGQDFSAARNFAIEQASSDWIYIDADERLEVLDRAVWRDIVADKRKAGWKLRFDPRLAGRPMPNCAFSATIHAFAFGV